MRDIQATFAKGGFELVADCVYGIKASIYPPDEIAARFHHRLTRIHPFPNAKGRHARLATDLLLVSLGRLRYRRLP